MTTLEDIEKFIEQKLKQANLSMMEQAKITAPFVALSEAKQKLEESKKVANKTGINTTSLEFYLSELYSNQNKRIKDQTSFNLFAKLPVKPYAKTTVGDTVVIHREGIEKHTDDVLDAKRVFTQLIPGQTTFRWGYYEQYRIPSGVYAREGSNEFVSNLKNIHDLEETPFFVMPGTNIGVYRLKKLNAISLQGVTASDYFDHESGEYVQKQGGIPICPVCLSINIKSGKAAEQCYHLRPPATATPIGYSSLYATPNLEYVESVSERNIAGKQNFAFPLNEIFEKIEFLEKTRITTIAKGFSREVKEVNVQVNYNPYLGYETDTVGLLFTLKELPTDFINEVLTEDFLVRDIVIDILQEKIHDVLTNLNRSLMEHEFWLSVVIKALELDNVSTSFGYKEISSRLNDADFDNTFETFANEERRFYEHPPSGLDRQAIPVVCNEIKNITISENDLKSKIKNLIKNSLSYLVYQTGLITSGSTSEDIGFIHPKEDSNEILIYDDVDGGNGASRLVNEYLIGQALSYSPLHGVRPKFFQETFFDKLQPCSQGTADRIFFQDLDKIFTKFSKKTEITKRFMEIKEKQTYEHDVFDYIKHSGIQNMFPHSIGKRALPGTAGENKKIQEVANICIHGCFECGVLQGDYSAIKGPKLEKFYVSKYLLDKYFKFITQGIRKNFDTDVDEIIKFLKNNDMMIISQKSTNNEFSKLIEKINLLLGEEEGDRLVKCSGLWFDCPISSTEIEMSVLLAMIKIPKKEAP